MHDSARLHQTSRLAVACYGPSVSLRRESEERVQLRWSAICSTVQVTLRQGRRWTLIPASHEKGEATFVVDSQKGSCEVEIAFAGGAHDGAKFVLKPELPLVGDSKLTLRG